MTLAGLLDLPTEILARIFEDPSFPINSLYYLSLLSRRLHFIALPLYFARNKLDYASGAVIITMGEGAWDLLTALQSALFISAMEDITCILPHPSCTSIAPFLFHLARVKRFIARFPSVKKVTLRLDDAGSRCLSVGSDKTLRAWASTFGDLLNYIVDKKCVSLTILHGGHLTNAYELSRGAPPPSLGRRIIAPIRRLLRSEVPEDQRDFQRSSGQGVAWVVVPANTSPSLHLTSLHIQSSILLLPPCLNWTLGTLRNCPLKNLTIANVWLRRSVWSVVLPHLAAVVPNLTALTLMDLQDLADHDLVAFCTRIPNLTDLDIKYRMPHPGPDAASSSVPGPSLRHLVRIKAPAALLVYFLRQNPLLPSLQSLTVLCSHFDNRPGDTGAARIARLLSALTLELQRLGLGPTIALATSESYDTMSVDLPAHASLTDTQHAALACVEAVELMVQPFFYADSAEIGRWLGVFTGARRMAISIETPAVDAPRHTELMIGAMSPTVFLQTVDVNGTTYDLERKSVVVES